MFIDFILQLKVALDYGNDADFETNLWTPSSDCDAAKFLTDYRKKKKVCFIIFMMKV